MKRKFILSSILSLITSIHFTFFSTSMYAAEKPTLVRVGVYDNRPKVYFDDMGIATGIFPDILNFIAQQEKWDIRYVRGTWDEGLDRLAKGEIDMMVDVATSPEREAIFDFNNTTVLNSWGVIFVQKNSDIENMMDLDNKKIAVLKSGIYYEGPDGIKRYLEDFGMSAEFIDVKEYSEVFELLNNGEVDAAIVSRIFGTTNKDKYPNIKATSILLEPTKLKFAFTKGDANNEYLIERIDFWLPRLIDGYNGVYNNSLQKHGLTEFTLRKEVIPTWAIVTGEALIGAITILIIFIFALRKAKVMAVNELEKREKLLGSIVQRAPLLVFSFDNSANVTFTEGQSLADIDINKGDKMNPELFMQLKKVFDGDTIEIQKKIKDKVWKIIVSPIQIGGEIKSAAGIALDMTKDAQLELAKKEFLKLASHHLRTIPTAIKWTCENLSPVVEKTLNKRDLEQWKLLVESSSNMITLAKTLTSATTLGIESTYASPEKFNITELINEEIQQLGSLIDEKKISLSKNFNDIELLFTSKGIVKLVVNTLLVNAIRYNVKEGAVNINTFIKNKTLSIEVSDTGIGIPRDEQDKIFTGMYRASNASKIYSSGIGLSLFIAKSQLEKLGGRIWFESEENKGTTFFLELPL